MLNLLSIYAGFVSWHDFRKNSGLQEILSEETLTQELQEDPKSKSAVKTGNGGIARTSFPEVSTEIEEKPVLQNTNTEYQPVNEIRPPFETYDTEQKPKRKSLKRYLLGFARSEEHTSELQSRENLVCRL